METLPSDHGKTLGELRNIVVSLTNEPFVTFMDDDDIYFHTCLLARIKTLIKYNIDCVGSVSIGNYDLLQEKGSVASDGPHVFSEASMAFRRSFWEERGFSNKEKSGEAHGFLLGRQLNCLSIPYHFNLLALSHSENTTGTLRMIEGKELIPLKKLLTEEELSIVESTSKYLRQRYRVVKVPPKTVPFNFSGIAPGLLTSKLLATKKTGSDFKSRSGKESLAKASKTKSILIPC